MADNLSLNYAKYNKNDEFYTMYTDIEKELDHYSDKFRDKVVYCNCDNPYRSNFFKYFVNKFEELGLKELICTNYCGIPSVNPLFAKLSKVNTENKAYVARITKPGSYGEALNSIERLEGDGSYDSKECKELLSHSDVIVTNPPFSLFRDYVNLLIKYDKDFIIVGNQNAVTYKNIFDRLSSGDIRVGSTFPKKFNTPSGEIANLGNVCWFTTLEISKDTPEYTRSFYHSKYYKYINLDCIHINTLEDIPSDYYGYMGVPMTFISAGGDNNEFEICGTSTDFSEITHIGKEFIDLYKSQGNKGHYTDNMRILGYVDKSGNAIIPYKRLIVKRILPKKYKKYDNYDAIHLEKVSDIPLGYNGLMGVPINFINDYDEDEFEVVCFANGNLRSNVSEDIKNEVGYIPMKNDKGGVPILDGSLVYPRIIVRRK